MNEQDILKAVEILKNEELRGCGNVWDYALEDAINALQNGYTLCKINENSAPLKS